MISIKTIILMQLLLLVGCVNKKTPDSNHLWLKIQEKYRDKSYRQVVKLVKELETYHPDLDCTRDALVLSAKSCFIAGEKSKSKFYLTECIKLCDFIIVTDEEYAKKNDLYLLKVRAYYNAIDPNLTRCVEMARDTLDAIKTYKQNSTQKQLSLHKKEIENIERKCNEYLIKKDLRMVDLLFKNTKYAPALDQINIILDSYPSITSQVLYEKIRVLIELGCNVDVAIDLLANLIDDAKSKNDKVYVEQSIKLIEKRFKLNSVQKSRMILLKKRNQNI